MKKDIRTMAALLMASATFVACSDKDDIISENQQPVNPTGKYTMTINASKGDDATTRALNLSGKTLSAKWAATDEVSVYQADWSATLGTLTAAASETGSTTLTGDLSSAPTAGDDLNLLFPRAEWEYTGQTGVLLDDANSIEKKYDYALAPVTVKEVNGNTITTTGNANFASQQAIVKFILKDKSDNSLLNASSLTISAASNKLVTAKGYGVKSPHTGYTVTGGSGGGIGQQHSNLVDGNTSTKWCQSPSPWYIEFNTASAVQVDGYTLTTGDNFSDYGRKPQDWVLYGKLNAGDSWTTIATVTNDTNLPDVANTSIDFTVDNPGSYQYFKFVVTRSYHGSVMELSELQLWQGSNGTAFGTTYGPLTITPASATNEMTVALRNENASTDTYTLTANVGGINYTYEKSGVTFESGKYYEVTVKMTQKAPALGDLYYSDGSYNTTLQAGKTPIGIIVYLGSDSYTENGTSVGGSTFAGHGLVMALKNAASGIAWSTEFVLKFPEQEVYDVNDLKRTENVSGYTNTATLTADAATEAKYPAAAAAKNYTPAAPAGTTGWFLPSAQQWVKAITGLGAVSPTAVTWGSWFDTSQTGANQWEAALSKACSGNYDSMNAELRFWSNSEVGNWGGYDAVNVYVNATGLGTGNGFGFKVEESLKNITDDKYRVRPFLAF